MTTIYVLTDKSKNIKGIVVSLESADLKFKVTRALKDAGHSKEFTMEEDDITGDISINNGQFVLITINKFY